MPPGQHQPEACTAAALGRQGKAESQPSAATNAAILKRASVHPPGAPTPGMPSWLARYASSASSLPSRMRVAIIWLQEHWDAGCSKGLPLCCRSIRSGSKLSVPCLGRQVGTACPNLGCNSAHPERTPRSRMPAPAAPISSVRLSTPCGRGQHPIVRWCVARVGWECP